MDVRQLFICHKQAFYDAYATWPDEKREFVAEFLHRDYMANKAGARARLFGGDEVEAPVVHKRNPWASKGAKAKQRDDLIDVVGPWGAVTRRR